MHIYIHTYKHAWTQEGGVQVCHLSDLAEALDLTPLESPSACRFNDIMGMFSSKSLEALKEASGSYSSMKAAVLGQMLQSRRKCVKHGGSCPVPFVDLDCSGPHCNEHSTQGGGLGREGETVEFFLTHCKNLKQKQTPAAILENVTTGEFTDLVCQPQLPVWCKNGIFEKLFFTAYCRGPKMAHTHCISLHAQTLHANTVASILESTSPVLRNENMSSDYHIVTISSKPQDLGFHAISRLRNFHLLIHKKKGQFVSNPQDLYTAMVSNLEGNNEVTLDSLFWETDSAELRKELLGSLTPNRLSDVQPEDSEVQTNDWTPYLTTWERKNLQKYTDAWLEKHGSLQDAVFILHQNPDVQRTWTCTGSGQPVMPTLCLSLTSMFTPGWGMAGVYIYFYMYTLWIPKRKNIWYGMRENLHFRLKGSGVTRVWHAEKKRWATAREKQLGKMRPVCHLSVSAPSFYYIYI